MAEACLILLVLAVPLIFDPLGRDTFRLPKRLAAEWLGLGSLFFLSFRLWRPPTVERVDTRQARHWVQPLHWLRSLRWPALIAVLPLVALAALSWATTDHPWHVRRGLAALAIGAACFAGWSVALPAARLRRLLHWMLWPAVLLALLAILQFHGLYQPFGFAQLHLTQRTEVTSLAGNVGDLAGFLVLPCFLAQALLLSARGKSRLAASAVLLLLLYALVLSQTLAAALALAAGSAVFWLLHLPRRRRPFLIVGAAVALSLALLAAPPLRSRVGGKIAELNRSDWNALLTGRLDGWRAAVWMLGEHPLRGVGHGAYRAEYIPAKEALAERGVEFWAAQIYPVFANAHNDFLEVGADLGLPGLLALAWGLALLGRALVKLPRSGERRPERALAVSGVAALAVLALAHFPFRIALVGYPALLFLAWAFAAAEEES